MTAGGRAVSGSSAIELKHGLTAQAVRSSPQRRSSIEYLNEKRTADLIGKALAISDRSRR
jgi:hypothetical protein